MISTATLAPEYCGPCHRKILRKGLPSMAIPSMPELDTAGGVCGICSGFDGKEHSVRLDYLGEPFSAEKKAAYDTKRIMWNEDVKAGHSLITMAVPKEKALA